jgi:hypothetical protein
MVTDCGGLGFWDLSATEAVFWRGSLSLLIVAIPLAMVVLVWEIYFSNKRSGHKNTSVLNLSEKFDLPRIAGT